MGHLADHEAGETAFIVSGGSERAGKILTRVVLEPAQQGGLWDALVGKFKAMPWGDLLEVLRHASLRDALEEIRRELEGPLAVEDIVGQLLQEAADAQLERQRIRRRVVDRIALRDQLILDKFQGEILVERVFR
jgi:hypothetical protein